MYCPVCGAESTQGLNYCKRCGASLGSETNPRHPGVSARHIVLPLMTISAVSIVGLIGLFATLNENQAVKQLPPPYLTGVLLFASATVFGVVAMLIWSLLRLTGSRDGAQPVAMRPTSEPARLLSTPPPTFTSITEHTTKGFPQIESDQPVVPPRVRQSERR